LDGKEYTQEWIQKKLNQKKEIFNHQIQQGRLLAYFALEIINNE
jgi:hypothetical protein